MGGKKVIQSEQAIKVCKITQSHSLSDLKISYRPSIRRTRVCMSGRAYWQWREKLLSPEVSGTVGLQMIVARSKQEDELIISKLSNKIFRISLNLYSLISTILRKVNGQWVEITNMANLSQQCVPVAAVLQITVHGQNWHVVYATHYGSGATSRYYSWNPDEGRVLCLYLFFSLFRHSSKDNGVPGALPVFDSFIECLDLAGAWRSIKRSLRPLSSANYFRYLDDNYRKCKKHERVNKNIFEVIY